MIIYFYVSIEHKSILSSIFSLFPAVYEIEIQLFKLSETATL